MALTSAEQYLLELINRARLDPFAEAKRYGLALNADLPPGTINGVAKQVLAPNELLNNAAEDHSIWMLQQDIFSHTGAGSSNPGMRMAAAGYEFTGAWSWRENLAWSGTTAAIDLETSIDVHHEGLYRSEGHRKNTFGVEVREIGIGQVQGVFTQNGTQFNASMLTLNYATSSSLQFITGVAYSDVDENGFYGIDEGRSGITFVIDAMSYANSSAGGYSIASNSTDAKHVQILDGVTQKADLYIDLRNGNAKLDYVHIDEQEQRIDLSTSANLISGVGNARLLGVADLSLTGSSAANTLTGNGGRNTIMGETGNDHLAGGKGSDRLFGGDGNDIIDGGNGRDLSWSSFTGSGSQRLVSYSSDLLSGGDGDDVLKGQSGTDVLDGGQGDDRLDGGSGRDTFIFNDGVDTITDFTPNVDQITIESLEIGISIETARDAIESAQFINGDSVIDFGGGNILILKGIETSTEVNSDILFV